MTADLD